MYDHWPCPCLPGYPAARILPEASRFVCSFCWRSTSPPCCSADRWGCCRWLPAIAHASVGWLADLLSTAWHALLDHSYTTIIAIQALNHCTTAPVDRRVRQCGSQSSNTYRASCQRAQRGVPGARYLNIELNHAYSLLGCWRGGHDRTLSLQPVHFGRRVLSTCHVSPSESAVPREEREERVLLTASKLGASHIRQAASP